MVRNSRSSVYLDHAAATPLDKRVFAVMKPYLAGEYGNPSALYTLGTAARSAVEHSRSLVAGALHTQPDTIVFTSGGTESNNLALFGVALEHAGHGKHIVVSAVEHDSVLEPVRELERRGWSVTIVPVGRAGKINPDAVMAAVKPETVLVSIMYANNEIGTIQPIAEIGKKIVRYRVQQGSTYPYFHTDACQAAGYLDLSVEKLHVDLMTLNSGKVYGPKGVGCLFVRRGVVLKPLLYGGQQERGLRAGTENVAGIVGFAKALELCQKERERETARLQKLSSEFWKKLLGIFPQVVLNGPAIGGERLPGNVNIQFVGTEGEKLVLYLNEAGVFCSTGSACSLESGNFSHVLKAIGLNERSAGECVRFSLGKTTKQSSLDFALRAIVRCLKITQASH